MTHLPDRAWALLADGLTPHEIVRALTPATRDEAIHQARRLPVWHERPEADRGAALARLAARAGMKRFRLTLEPDGRVADDPYHRKHRAGEERAFPCTGGTVTYTPRYVFDKDHFQFLGDPEPGPWEYAHHRPLPLSPTGHWSHFADPDAVQAMGGPEAYIAALEAAGRDGGPAFDRGFTWAEPEPPPRKPKPVVGEHTARVVRPPPKPPSPPTAIPAAEAEPGRLF